MTRQDLVNKSIDKLNTVKEALELIEILEYDECIAVLTGTKNLPSEIHRLCKSHRTHRTPLMQQRRSDRHRSG